LPSQNQIHSLNAQPFCILRLPLRSQPNREHYQIKFLLIATGVWLLLLHKSRRSGAGYGCPNFLTTNHAADITHACSSWRGQCSSRNSCQRSGYRYRRCRSMLRVVLFGDDGFLVAYMQHTMSSTPHEPRIRPVVQSREQRTAAGYLRGCFLSKALHHTGKRPRSDNMRSNCRLVTTFGSAIAILGGYLPASVSRPGVRITAPTFNPASVRTLVQDSPARQTYTHCCTPSKPHTQAARASAFACSSLRQPHLAKSSLPLQGPLGDFIAGCGKRRHATRS